MYILIYGMDNLYELVIFVIVTIQNNYFCVFSLSLSVGQVL